MVNVKNMKMNNNLRPMYVKEIILEKTDENHFITVNEILALLESSYGISTTRKTIYDDIQMLMDAGFDIECVKGRQNKYHVLFREFDIAELRIIIDAVKAIRSLPITKNNGLVKKISRLAGPSADYLLQSDYIDVRPRIENSQVYYIIDRIYEAITKRKQIVFKYFECISQSKQHVKNIMKTHRVSPYRLFCCNEYYYLLGYSAQNDKIIAFRIERIQDIPTISTKDIVPEPENLYLDRYKISPAQNTDDNEAEVNLEFQSSVIDAILDRFGQDIEISYISDTVCRAKVREHLNASFFAWLFGLEGKVIIKGPEDAYYRYVRMVSREMARL